MIVGLCVPPHVCNAVVVCFENSPGIEHQKTASKARAAFVLTPSNHAHNGTEFSFSLSNLK